VDELATSSIARENIVVLKKGQPYNIGYYGLNIS